MNYESWNLDDDDGWIQGASEQMITQLARSVMQSIGICVMSKSIFTDASQIVAGRGIGTVVWGAPVLHPLFGVLFPHRRPQIGGPDR
jgi:hypothetical protein